MGLGTASNQAVKIANHDKFPVLDNGYHYQVNDDGMMDDEHCVMTSETRLNALADIFDFEGKTLSIGDMLLNLGDWLREVGYWAFPIYLLAINGVRKRKDVTIQEGN